MPAGRFKAFSLRAAGTDRRLCVLAIGATVFAVAAVAPNIARASPTNSVSPSIAGTAVIGSQLSVDPGTWSGSGAVSYAYQWRRCPVYSGVVLDDSPVGYWRLDDSVGDTDALDYSGNGFNGTYSSTGVTLGAAEALVGDDTTAATFDGTSGYVSVPDAPELTPANAITIEAWIKPTVGGFDQAKYIVVKRYVAHNSPYNSYGLTVADTSDGTRPHRLTFSLSLGGTYRETNVIQGWSYGVWNHIVATYDGAMTRIYVNGSQVAQNALSGTITPYATPLLIGAWVNSSNVVSQAFTGGIDEVAIYDHALSAATIASHYQEGTTQCNVIAGATGQNYTVATGDAGFRLRAVVTATDSTGSATLPSDISSGITNVDIDPLENPLEASFVEGYQTSCKKWVVLNLATYGPADYFSNYNNPAPNGCWSYNRIPARPDLYMIYHTNSNQITGSGGFKVFDDTNPGNPQSTESDQIKKLIKAGFNNTGGLWTEFMGVNKNLPSSCTAANCWRKNTAGGYPITKSYAELFSSAALVEDKYPVWNPGNQSYSPATSAGLISLGPFVESGNAEYQHWTDLWNAILQLCQAVPSTATYPVLSAYSNGKAGDDIRGTAEQTIVSAMNACTAGTPGG